MKLLCMFEGRRAIPHLQINYIYALKKWFDVFIYGPNEYEINDRDIAPIEFSSELDIIDLCNQFKPDAIILPEYASTRILSDFFGDLNRVKSIPIISIEDVYHNEDSNWHFNKGIDYVISRVPVEDDFFSVPSYWLPWAADDRFSSVAHPWYSRYNKVLFIGEGFYSQNVLYTTRKKAIYVLGVNNLLDSFRSSTFDFYMGKLGKYRYFLSDAWYTLKTVPPKTFEAMAAGCTVLSPEFLYGKELFGNDECFIKYDMDCEDLLGKVNYCKGNPEYSYSVSLSGRKVVLEKHMFSNRVQELSDIITDILNGTEVRKKWGI